MKVGLNKRQYKLISELVKQEIDEQGDINSEPSAGTSQTQSGGQGYPQVGKWESGVTRGPANQIGVTKWSDVVGATLKRGKANQLKEENLSEQQNSQSYVGKERPSEIIPMKDLDPRLCNVILKPGEQNPCYVKKKIPGTTIGGDYLYVGYRSPIKGTVTGTIEQIKPQHEKEVDTWLKQNLGISLADEKRFSKRKSKKGRDVPKGFNPDKYDEYYEKKSILDNKFMLKRQELGRSSDPQKRSEINKELKLIRDSISNLNKQYYSKEFSYGPLSTQDRELYDQRVTEIKEDYEKKLEIFNQKCGALKQSNIPSSIDNTDIKINTPMGQKSVGYQYKDICEQEFLKLGNEYKMEMQRTNFMFGRDDWSKSVGMFGEKFDKFWDNWGTLISIAGNIAVIAYSGGIAAGFSGLLRGTGKLVGIAIDASGKVRAIAPYATDAAFNALVGSYEISRGKQTNALVSMMCAIVPFISYGKNIGKISVSEAKEMIDKINKVNLNNPVEIQTLVNSFNDRQRYIFRNVTTLPKEVVKQNYDLILKTAQQKVKKVGISVPKNTIKQSLPPLLKILAVEGGIPVVTYITNMYLNLFKDTSIEFTKEQLTDIKSFIKIQTENSSFVESLIIMNHVVENIDKIQDVESFKNIFKEGLKPATDPSEEDLKKLAVLFGTDVSTLKSKRSNTKLKDLKQK